MLDQLEGKNSEIANTEQILKTREDAFHVQQADLQKQKDLSNQLDADLIQKQLTVQQLQNETFEVAKQKQEYADMAGQLENRLQKVSDELEKARQNQGLKDTIEDLSNKLKEAEEQGLKKLREAENSTRVAQEQKVEISEQLSKMIKEKKQALEDLKSAEKKEQLA